MTHQTPIQKVLEDAPEKLDKMMYETDHGSLVLSPTAIKKYFSTSLTALLKAIDEEAESMKQTVPKSPLDITPREAMRIAVQPIYRPYISNEETHNQALSDLQSRLKAYIK